MHRVNRNMSLSRRDDALDLAHADLLGIETNSPWNESPSAAPVRVTWRHYSNASLNLPQHQSHRVTPLKSKTHDPWRAAWTCIIDPFASPTTWSVLLVYTLHNYIACTHTASAVVMVPEKIIGYPMSTKRHPCAATLAPPPSKVSTVHAIYAPGESA